MSLFTEIFVTKVVKIKELRAKNVNIMHLVLNEKFFKIYLSIFKFLKEKKWIGSFNIIRGAISKLSPTLGTLLLGENWFPKNILDKVVFNAYFPSFSEKT